MPAPPFPAPDDERLEQIVRETVERFDPIDIVPAIAYASALAWVAGEQEGGSCPGCGLNMANESFASAVRRGEVELRFFQRRPRS